MPVEQLGAGPQSFEALMAHELCDMRADFASSRCKRLFWGSIGRMSSLVQIIVLAKLFPLCD